MKGEREDRRDESKDLQYHVLFSGSEKDTVKLY